MKETVLVYNFTDESRAAALKKALLPLGLRIKGVNQQDYLRPVGVLAGVKGLSDVDTVYEGPGFTDEMLVMAGFSSGQVDGLIQALRKTGVGKVNYKAILTETNRSWNSLELFRELKKEHEKMKDYQK